MSAKNLKSSELIEAIRTSNLNQVIAALDAGADVNEADIHGHAGLPLRTACFSGNVPIIRELLDRGANVNATTPDGGGAPIRLALRAGHREVAALLIARDAEIPFGLDVDPALLERAEILAGRVPENYIPDLEFEAVSFGGVASKASDTPPPADLDNVLEFVSALPEPEIVQVDVKGGAYGVDTNVLALDFEKASGSWEKVERAAPSKDDGAAS